MLRACSCNLWPKTELPCLTSDHCPADEFWKCYANKAATENFLSRWTLYTSLEKHTGWIRFILSPRTRSSVRMKRRSWRTALSNFSYCKSDRQHWHSSVKVDSWWTIVWTLEKTRLSPIRTYSYQSVKYQDCLKCLEGGSGSVHLLYCSSRGRNAYLLIGGSRSRLSFVQWGCRFWTFVFGVKECKGLPQGEQSWIFWPNFNWAWFSLPSSRRN